MARYGGEEFAVLLPGKSRRDAVLLAEQVRQHVASNAVDTGDGQALQVTISVGVATGG